MEHYVKLENYITSLKLITKRIIKNEYNLLLPIERFKFNAFIYSEMISFIDSKQNIQKIIIFEILNIILKETNLKPKQLINEINRSNDNIINPICLIFTKKQCINEIVEYIYQYIIKKHSTINFFMNRPLTYLLDMPSLTKKGDYFYSKINAIINKKMEQILYGK